MKRILLAATILIGAVCVLGADSISLNKCTPNNNKTAALIKYEGTFGVDTARSFVGIYGKAKSSAVPPVEYTGSGAATGSPNPNDWYSFTQGLPADTYDCWAYIKTLGYVNGVPTFFTLDSNHITGVVVAF